MTLAKGVLVLALILLTNVVGAGVFLVLGPLVPEGNAAVTVLGMYAVGAVAIGCAILFLLGALQQLPRIINALPRRS